MDLIFTMLPFPYRHFEKNIMILGDLPNYDCSVDGQTLVNELAGKFKLDQGLPGVLVLSSGGSLLGMVSRDNYFENLGRPYGVELYSKISVSQFYRQIGSPPLVLDATIRIEEAVKIGLSRNARMVYEPIVIRYANHSFKLINMHTLLSAQCDLLEKLYVEVQQLSFKDPLTNIRNRRGFFEDAHVQIEKALNKQVDLSALMIDIDNFKIVNDIYGHFIGDKILKSVAEECNYSLRQTDLLGRFGGEEFIALLPDTNLQIALMVAERVRDNIEHRQVYIDGYQISVTVSIGVSHIRDLKGSLDQLLSHADKAMYAAKKKGRNQVKAYEKEMENNFNVDITDEKDVMRINELHRNFTQAARIYDETIEGWAHALELRDKEAAGHSQRVTSMTIELAKRLGVMGEDLVDIRRGALLHDIGKIAIPDNILFKPDKLSAEEWEIMKKHPTYAFELLSPIVYLQGAIDIPYYHHEHWDGTGYPQGLQGDNIPFSARIFTIVDVWDALSTDRCYRSAWYPEQVRKYIEDESGKLFDPVIVEAFLDLLHDLEANYQPKLMDFDCPVFPSR